MSEIKTCPFCRGAGGVHTLSNQYAQMHKVCCMGEVDPNCAGLGLDEYDESVDIAISVWNKRA